MRKRKTTKCDVCGFTPKAGPFEGCSDGCKWYHRLPAEEREAIDRDVRKKLEARKRAAEKARSIEEEKRRQDPDRAETLETMRRWGWSWARARENVEWRKKQRAFEARPFRELVEIARLVNSVCPHTAEQVMNGTMTLCDAFESVTALGGPTMLCLMLINEIDPDCSGTPEMRERIEREYHEVVAALRAEQEVRP
jgi:hypothetical protein